MELDAAKMIGAGLAVIALAGVGVGIGILGFALTEAIALFALLISFLILFT
jgi:F0F1-type ATP synthase membrane subunit c/vacuolar-type H+-ATPase subunit K